MGLHTFVVTPCRSGGTLWKIDMWHGRVMHGITLRAAKLEAPRARTLLRAGVRWGESASGRRPSIMIRMTMRGIIAANAGDDIPRRPLRPQPGWMRRRRQARSVTPWRAAARLSLQ
jgi:hypothetical protein